MAGPQSGNASMARARASALIPNRLLNAAVLRLGLLRRMHGSWRAGGSGIFRGYSTSGPRRHQRAHAYFCINAPDVVAVPRHTTACLCKPASLGVSAPQPRWCAASAARPAGPLQWGLPLQQHMPTVGNQARVRWGPAPSHWECLGMNFRLHAISCRQTVREVVGTGTVGHSAQLSQHVTPAPQVPRSNPPPGGGGRRNSGELSSAPGYPR